MSRKSIRYTKAEVFTFLDDLHDNGRNMFRTPPDVTAKFGVTEREARRLISMWVGDRKYIPGLDGKS